MSSNPKKVPCIRTALPGPKAKQLIAAEEKVISPSYTRDYPLVVRRGSGLVIEDVDGNTFLDFAAGIAVCATGHCHPRVVAAIRRQAGELLHICGADYHYAPMKDLALKLAEIAPGKSPKRVYFGNSGAEAVEAAFKLARYATKRPRMIAFLGGFHGRTMGALALTGSKAAQRRGFGTLVPDVTHIPYAYCYRCAYRLAPETCDLACVGVLEDTLFRKTLPPEDVAAVIVEPIQGEGGYIVPPPGFHKRLKALTEKYGILFIADEVQSGMGRTGRMFAIEHWGVTPDIVCAAKGLASGLPLGAMIARGDIMQWPRGAHGSTFGGNPVACAAALETIRLVQEGLMDNAEAMGRVMMEGLKALKSRHLLIGDVRGVGLMIGIEIVSDPVSKAPAVAERNDIVVRCFQKGLVLLGCGESVVRFSPPLVVTKAECATALLILDEVLTDVETERLAARRKGK